MKPLAQLQQWLLQHADPEHYLFAHRDLRALFPDLSNSHFKTLISRAVKAKVLERICRGLFMFEPAAPNDGRLLFHAAARLRANHFNYISLETVLSEAGVISQVPFNWISIMSSGSSGRVDCGDFGTIEFVHTQQKPDALTAELSYDANCHLWRASITLALRDMRVTNRNMDLIDWSRVDELT